MPEEDEGKGRIEVERQRVGKRLGKKAWKRSHCKRD
jgi:hypothetical protein